MGRKRRDGRKAREERARKRLESYRSFIDDWDAFQEAIRRPEPTTLRTNLVRTDRETLARRLEAQGFTVAELPHQPAFLRVEDGPFAVSDTLEHWSGLFYIQQSVTGLAAPLLDPRPGERVLDLCSAPGGKTTHLAELMEGRGSVVCADVNEGRIRALLGNIYRLGHANIMTVAGDGRHFPTGATFDRVLVDVPCSAEGTLRKKGGMIPGHSGKWSRQVTRAQEKLLRRSVELTRPGGTLLYVTCTFGPEENEAVLTRVLADTALEVESMEMPLPHAPGLTAHADETYDPRLERALRFYPHHLDSGGLFICRLRKAGEGGEGHDPAPDPSATSGGGGTPATRGWSAVPRDFPVEEGEDPHPDHAPAAPDPDGPTPGEELEAGAEFLLDQLGVDRASLGELKWMRRGTNLWAHSLNGWPMDSWTVSGRWRAVAVGFRALDAGGDGPPRPTNDLLAWLDGRITRARIELDAGSWVRLLEERSIPWDAPEGLDGIVALSHDGTVLGRGFYRGGVLRHEIPKGRLNWLRNLMDIRAS